MPKSTVIRAAPWGRRLLAALLLALPLILPSSIYAASDLDAPEDFTEIAKNGFAWVVDGTANLVPNVIGSERNAYAWSMYWFQNRLYVGTLRNSHCTLEDTEDPVCVEFRANGFPDDTWRAEIWLYTPDGETGLEGRWERVHQSPNIAFGRVVQASAGIPRTTPRDFGYRGMTVCNAGDGVDRLYIGAAGIPANLLFHNGGSGGFYPTSPLGTSNGLIDLYNMDFDLSYRALACFKGRLWISPSGTAPDPNTGELPDPDGSLHPVVLMNTAPAQGLPWQTVVDVSQGHPLSNPNNGGVFQMEAVGNYLYLSVGNRVNGMELWRGDGTRCLPPWQGGCTMTWEKIFDQGAGRPDDESGRNPEVDNAGATLGVFGNDLYIGSAESAYADSTSAEMLRVRDAGGPSPKWELLVGWPRPGYLTDPKLGSNFECLNPGEIENGSAPDWLVDLNTETPGDDCFPVTGYGPGMGTVSSDDGSTVPSPYRTGQDAYFWRFQEYKGDLFMGSLTIGGRRNTRRGANLWRFTNKAGDAIPEVTQVFAGGLNNEYNWGIRTFAATPFGLALGTANYGTLREGLGGPLNGTEVIVGANATQEEDAMPPQVSITFPANLRTYSASAFAVGCGTPYPDLCGTADDDDGVFEVQVSIRNLATGRWWNGLAFVSTQQTWSRAEGKDNWSYAFKPLVVGVYEVVTKAIDYAGNEARRTHRFAYR